MPLIQDLIRKFNLKAYWPVFLKRVKKTLDETKNLREPI